jgi:phosphatidylserine decarboxylase
MQDYHRFHLPVSGTIRCIRHVRGKLYTVNPIAVASTYANVFTQVQTCFCMLIGNSPSSINAMNVP